MFNDSDLERLNSKYLKTLTYENLKKTFDVKYDEKFWDIIKNNVDELKEIDEWYQILNCNHDQKIDVEPELQKLIKEYLTT